MNHNLIIKNGGKGDSSIVKMRRLVTSQPEEAKIILASQKVSQTRGWCQLSTLRPTKQNGYIQVSGNKVNKFILLHHLVLAAQGPPVGTFDENGKVSGGMHVSHLCGQPRCMTMGHMVAEDSVTNNSRKGCVVWIPCPHANGEEGSCKHRYILVCPHSPPCVKYVEGFRDMAGFIEQLPDSHICK